jgi:hypothetical protein
LRPANSTSNENVSSSNDGVANVDDISHDDNSSTAIAQLSSDLLSLNLGGADRDDLPTGRVDRVRAVNDSAGQSSSEASDIANPRTSRSEE